MRPPNKGELSPLPPVSFSIRAACFLHPGSQRLRVIRARRVASEFSGSLGSLLAMHIIV
jgi:hypothetical protein